MEISSQENPQSTLKAFETIQMNLAMAGFDRKLAAQSVPLNGKILMCFLLLGPGITFISVHTFNYAETFFEYTQSVYMTTSGIFITMTLIVLILKVQKIFEFINCCNNFINTSKLNFKATQRKYLSSLLITIDFSIEIRGNKINLQQTNQFEEKLSKILFFIMIKLTPAFGILPWFIYVFFVYFTSDLGPEAFKLPFPMW